MRLFLQEARRQRQCFVVTTQQKHSIRTWNERRNALSGECTALYLLSLTAFNAQFPIQLTCISRVIDHETAKFFLKAYLLEKKRHKICFFRHCLTLFYLCVSQRKCNCQKVQLRNLVFAIIAMLIYGKCQELVMCLFLWA